MRSFGARSGLFEGSSVEHRKGADTAKRALERRTYDPADGSEGEKVGAKGGRRTAWGLRRIELETHLNPFRYQAYLIAVLKISLPLFI